MGRPYYGSHKTKIDTLPCGLVDNVYDNGNVSAKDLSMKAWISEFTTEHIHNIGLIGTLPMQENKTLNLVLVLQKEWNIYGVVWASLCGW